MTVASFSPLVLDQFQILFSTSDDVEQLNRAILQLAVQGKLAEQDSNDEMAKEILKRIQEEKANKQNSKLSRPLPIISETETPFSIPASWTWVRLGEITNYGTSERSKGINFTDDTWVLDLEDIEKITSRILKKVRFKERKFQSDKNVFQKGDVVYGKLRPYLDKVIVADEDGACSSELVPIKTYGGISPYYLRLALKSPEFVSYVNQKTYGVKMPRLGTQDARMALIPIPPLAEQERIVARVDELLAQTRQLAEKLARNEQELTLLNKSALAHLLASQTPEEFEQHWNFIAEHFDSLFTEPEHVAPLRQSILELAVRGKLTRREAGDESAGELLKRINEEKEKEGSIESLPKVKEDEKPFGLPEGWEWIRLEHLLPEFQNGLGRRVSANAGKEVIILRLADVGTGMITTENARSFVTPIEEINKYDLKEGDILITRVNGSIDLIGSFNLIPEDTLSLYCDHFIRMRLLIDNVLPMYLAFMSKSEFVRAQIRDKFITTAGQKTVNQRHISSLLFPLPPLAEQERIVAKVEQLLSLCDALESRLWEARESRGHLVESVLAGVA